MDAHPVRLYVQDHGFLIADANVDPDFSVLDYSTGLAGVTDAAALVAAGIDRGYVSVSAAVLDERPALDTSAQWALIDGFHDIAEFSLHADHGQLTVAPLESRADSTTETLPLLSPFGSGPYRIRLHASGRDRHYDQVVDDSGEHFHVLAWPEPVSAPLLIKATSRCGYGLRLNAHQQPSTTHLADPMADQQAAASHQAMLDRALRGTS